MSGDVGHRGSLRNCVRCSRQHQAVIGRPFKPFVKCIAFFAAIRFASYDLALNNGFISIWLFTNIYRAQTVRIRYVVSTSYSMKYAMMLLYIYRCTGYKEHVDNKT